MRAVRLVDLITSHMLVMRERRTPTAGADRIVESGPSTKGGAPVLESAASLNAALPALG
jgi:hypothetical protein